MLRSAIVATVLAAALPWAVPASAAVIAYADLVRPGARPIPYGEPIILHGRIADFDLDRRKLSDWLEFAELRFSYRVGTTGDTVSARLAPGHREWEVLLEPLPARSVFRFELTATLRPSADAARRIVDRVLDGEDYPAAVREFIGRASDPKIANAETESWFLAHLAGLLNREYPGFLELPALTLPATPALTDSLDSLVNLRTNIQDMQNERVPGVRTDQPLAANLRAAREASELSPAAQTARDQFTRNYEQATETLRATLVDTVTRTVTRSYAVPTTSTSTEELQKYAGIDYGVLYVPDADELRQFVLANIYLGSVDDSPTGLQGWANHLQSRVSLTVGWSVGDLSNNTGSDIDGQNAYALGLGYRLNKYFRASIGTMKYRAKSDGALRGEMFYGLSVDLTAFEALKGLVSK